VRCSIQSKFKWLSHCDTRVQLGFMPLAAVGLPSFAYATITAPTIANNTFASTAVGGSLTQTMILTLNSAETITSIVIQPGQPGATESQRTVLQWRYGHRSCAHTRRHRVRSFGQPLYCGDQSADCSEGDSPRSSELVRRCADGGRPGNCRLQR